MKKEAEKKERIFISWMEYYENIVKRPTYLFPLIVLSVLAYLPSVTNTKAQFEDFHLRIYFEPGKATLSGRWGMYLWGMFAWNAGNDVLNKYIGMFFLILFSVVLGGVFYYISVQKKGVLKYTLLSIIAATYPLINEIWSYNGANSIVCFNLFLGAVSAYIILAGEFDFRKKMLITTVPFVFMSSSYESGLFAYVTLVCMVLFYQMMKGKKQLTDCIKDGLVFAVPLLAGCCIGSVIGRLICKVLNLPYYRHGDTQSYWGNEGALFDMVKWNIDHYLLRGLVYFPIFVFLAACFVFACICFYYLFHGRIDILLAGAGTFGSVFLLSLIQGSGLPYRTAQTVTIFTACMFFFLMDFAENWNKQIRIVITVLMLTVCYCQSAFLERINRIDYQINQNDEDMVRRIGYELTTRYNGKPVLFVGNPNGGSYLYSDYLFNKISVDASSLNGRIYNRLRTKIMGGIGQKFKYFDTNLWSTLFLVSTEARSMEEYFSYCGYTIAVLDNTNIEAAYPEVWAMLDKGEIYTLQFVDMGDYVVVKL